MVTRIEAGELAVKRGAVVGATAWQLIGGNGPAAVTAISSGDVNQQIEWCVQLLMDKLETCEFGVSEIKRQDERVN